MRESAFYSLAEAAERLGVHYETVARWVRSGRLSAVRLSRRKILVPKAQCEALLGGIQEKKKPAGPETGSPQRWLMLVGTLAAEEAAKLRTLGQDFEETEAD